MNPIHTLALVASIGSSTVDAASDANLGQESEISTIKVTATRLEQDLGSVAAAISVVDGDQIQKMRQQLGLDEALAQVPGVFFQNRFNFAQDLRIAIRGFGARSNFGVRGIKILVDGIPETLADGQSQVDSIDLASIRRVEVLRGASSSIYGNAAGGVINIVSEQGGTEPFVEARFAFGEFGFQKHQVKVGGEIGRLDYLVSLSDLQVDGYRAHSEAENTQLNSRFVYRPNDESEFSATFSATDQPVSNDAGGVTLAAAMANPSGARDRNILFDAGEALDQQKLGLSYKRATGSGGELLVRNYYLVRDFRNRLPFTGGGIVAFERFFAGGGFSYTQPHRVGGVEQRLIVGVDYDRQDDDRQRFDNDSGIQGALTLEQNERITSTGFFLQDEIQLSERLKIAVGMRFDEVKFQVDDKFLSDGDDSGSRTLRDFSPSLGFVFDASAGISIYGNVATAFETPTSTEFANPNGGGFNPNVGPQKSTQIEVGLRKPVSDHGQLEVSVFDIDIDDELIPFEIATNPGRNFYANAGRSSRQGLEIAFRSEPVPGLNVSLAYTYSKFEFEEFVDAVGSDFSGNEIPGVPGVFAQADLSYRHDSGYFVAVDALYADEFFADNANLTKIDSSVIANLRVGYERTLGRVEINPFLGINNIADASYTANVRINAFGGRYFEPGPERALYAGVSIRYQY